MNKNGDLIMNSLLDGDVILSSGRGDVIVDYNGNQISILDQLQVLQQIVGQVCWSDPNYPLVAWTPFQPMPFPAWGIATAVIGSNIFIMGGFNGTNVLNSVQVYNVNTGLWSIYPSLTTARAFPYSSVSVDGNTIFVYGGTQGPTGTEFDLISVEVYNVLANNWTLLSSIESMPYAHYRGCSTVIEDEVYFFGGESRNVTGPLASSQISAYNMQTNIWKVFSLTMPVGRWNSAAVAANNNIYIIGGTNASGIVTELVDVLNTVNMQWSSGPSIGLGLQNIGAINFNGLIAMIGGSTAYVGTLTDVWVLNTRLNYWKTSVIGPLTNSRDSFGVAFVGKTIYAFGGRTFVQTITSMITPTYSVVNATEGIIGCF